MTREEKIERIIYLLEKHGFIPPPVVPDSREDDQGENRAND